MCSIAEVSHIQCEIPGFSHRNWNNVDYGVKFQEHFKKNNKDMSFDFSSVKYIHRWSIIVHIKPQNSCWKFTPYNVYSDDFNLGTT
jgi:hypothetical protein